LGHDDGQELLKRSDLPASGWITDLRRRGTKLVADVDQVAKPVVKLIRSGAYRTVSSEIYPDFQCQGRSYGPTLRQVALLGAEVPAVKTLADIPMPANGAITDLEVFDVGAHHDGEQRWTVKDLDRVVANFHDLKGKVDYSDRPSGRRIVLHHERSQPTMCNTTTNNVLTYSERDALTKHYHRHRAAFTEPLDSFLALGAQVKQKGMSPVESLVGRQPVSKHADRADSPGDYPGTSPGGKAPKPMPRLGNATPAKMDEPPPEGATAEAAQASLLADIQAITTALDDVRETVEGVDPRDATAGATLSAMREALTQIGTAVTTPPDADMPEAGAAAGQDQGQRDEVAVGQYHDRYSEQLGGTRAEFVEVFRRSRKMGLCESARQFLGTGR
jgi:hypothetical protein